MFSNDVSQTYNFQDASQEIIIMLLGAFLLGCLLTWLFSKLFNKDYTIENAPYRYESQNDEISTLAQTKIPQANLTNEVKIVDKPTNPINKALTNDDLTKISGIDNRIQRDLKEANITSFAELRDIKTKDLVALKNNQPYIEKEIETWPHQASLAAKGEWNKLTDYQNFIKRVQLASSTSQMVKPMKGDDLTQLEGISTDVERILYKNDISTFKQLSLMDSDTLKNHIVRENSQFIESDAESWPHQAAMAEKGQWEELKIYQDFMHSDSEIASNNSPDITSLDNRQDKPQNSDLPSKAINTQTHKFKSNDEILDDNLSDHDDLKKVEGIGPKIEEVLNQGGIYTFSQLYNSDRDRLRSLLDDAGSQFKMHDPESWPHQAGMANRNEWEELKSYQHSIATDKSRVDDQSANATINETSKLSIAHPKDDLTKIEGVGPKIQEILNNSGIYTFKRLSQSSTNSIKESLNNSGPQFRMHDPETWPQQALMASNSEWDELKNYQQKITEEQALKANNAAELKKSSKNKSENDKQMDDLKKIEGIGPKINELLNNAGIHTFEQLSEQSRDYIKELLNAAGPQFRMHEPESWPHQAKLAAKGDWEELKKYQNFLNAGRE